MKRLILIAAVLTCVLTANAQSDNFKFDQALATKLGADDYGMKRYVLVMLKTGTAGITDKKVVDSLFRGHFSNMQKLTGEGKLVVAGPIGKNDKNYRGIFILNVPKVEEARALVDTDPAVKAGMLDADLFPWYGSAALSEYLPYHDKVQKRKTF
ncbi:MAG: YciI family protein [Daejeonella sp.]|uniref:YciI family protein n=1 Tax=Daejeonella sp. JGW-45 TaxID=3034148 RepID=UPI0023EBA40D|nr:YciI family protein [Daejeonella sp. JGW-45]